MSSVDAQSREAFQEAPDARDEFSREELKHLRVVLRRLRFLDGKVRNGQNTNPDTNLYDQIEIEAIQWLLTEIGFLAEREDTK